MHDRVEVADRAQLGRKHDAGREVATTETDGEGFLGSFHPSRPNHEACADSHRTPSSILTMSSNTGNDEIVNYRDVCRVDRQPTLNILADLKEERKRRS